MPVAVSYEGVDCNTPSDNIRTLYVPALQVLVRYNDRLVVCIRIPSLTVRIEDIQGEISLDASFVQRILASLSSQDQLLQEALMLEIKSIPEPDIYN